MFKQRPYRGDADKILMLETAHHAGPTATHVVDLPYRLSSWSLDDPENVGLWEDETGKLAAWATFQFPMWFVDVAFDVRYDSPELQSQVLAWVDEKAAGWAVTSKARPCWFINVYSSQSGFIARLEQAGFRSQENVPGNPWSKVALELARPLLDPGPLPEGFSIRPLKGQAELEAAVALHRACFDSGNMTLAWRERLIQAPHYRPDLDLVVEALDGRLAGFWLGWFDQAGPGGQPTGQVEPMGVHPDFRQLGLGRKVLIAGLHNLKAAGAASIIVETDDYRNAAHSLYLSAGFELVQKVLIYRKNF